MIKQLTIIGVGLIGGSLARALKQVAYCKEIVGCGRDAKHLARAVELGVIDRYSTSVADAVQGADMVVVAVPLGVMEALFREMKPHLAEGAVITDVGSAKASVVTAALSAFGKLPAGFVPAHPIAGNEKSGVEASFAELFQQRRVIITPLDDSSPGAVEQVRAMWHQAGAVVDEMAVARHDEILAATSHLPHMLAYALVDTLLNLDESEEVLRFSAGGFRDFTRIASSDPVMWRDISLANRDALVVLLERFSQDLERLTEQVRRGDGEALKRLFERAKTARDRHIDGAVEGE